MERLLDSLQKEKKVLIVVSVITVKPFRTAVDFSCATETALPSDFGSSRKLTVSLYKELDDTLPYIGSDLGVNYYNCLPERVFFTMID